MANTYTKLKSGAWGVRAAGKVSDGATLTVAKKDGSTKAEVVEKVLWTGKDSKTGETISLCSIAQRAMGAAGGGHSSRGRCADCGRACNPKYRRCYDCGSEYRDGGSMAAGGRSYYDRNGNFVLGDDD